jgi:glucose-6-phosphate isomerase
MTPNHSTPATPSMNGRSQSPRLELDWTKIQDVCPIESKLEGHFQRVVSGKRTLLEKSGPGSQFTGWVDSLPAPGSALQENIKKVADRIAAHSDAIVVVGIGGSNLGAKAVFEALAHSYSALMHATHGAGSLGHPGGSSGRPILLWAGNHLATDSMAELLDALETLTPSLIVISKSGTTTEPALAFRVLKSYLDQRFGAKEAAARIFAITDPATGTLRRVAEQNQWTTFEIPPTIGGRYSVFTACGLLPLAAAGIDIDGFLGGARDAAAAAFDPKNEALETNPALCYAAVRNSLYEQGYKVEALCTWTPKLRTVSDWWCQLFGESDAKNFTGLFPTSAGFSTDLHSLGQYFQEGERNLFATHIRVMHERSVARGALDRQIVIPKAEGVDDGFDFLQDKNLGFVQQQAQEGTFLAHADGKCPTMVWSLPERNAYWLGYWMFSNMVACAAGGYARSINPFDQPGVEDYKRNMFALIGKPGLEKERDAILSRIERGRRLNSFGPVINPKK